MLDYVPLGETHLMGHMNPGLSYLSWTMHKTDLCQGGEIIWSHIKYNIELLCVSSLKNTQIQTIAWDLPIAFIIPLKTFTLCHIYYCIELYYRIINLLLATRILSCMIFECCTRVVALGHNELVWPPVANTLFETYQMLWSQATLISSILWLQNNYSYNSHLDSCHLAFTNDTGTGCESRWCDPEWPGTPPDRYYVSPGP